MFSTITPEKAGIASERIIEYIDYLEEHQFSMHSFLMAKGNDIFAEAYYAPFTRDTKHRMYSATKSFTALAIGFCEQDGLLSLDDKLTKFFPEYANLPKVNDFMREQTIRDMLIMSTSMLSSNSFFNTTRDSNELYFDYPGEKIPGTFFDYDSHGSGVMSCIVERVTGKKFVEYLLEKGLGAAGFSPDAYCIQSTPGNPRGGSGMMCTTRDLLILARFFMAKGVVNGKRYMNEKFLTDAVTKQISNNDSGFCEYFRHGYGYQVWITKHGFAFNGAGGQYAICFPEKDIVFVTTADNQGNAHSGELILDAFDHIIYNNIKEPLPENKNAYFTLKKRISDLKLFYLPVGEKNDFSHEINAKTYVLDTNPMGIKYVRFDFEDDCGILSYENEQGEKKIKFGFGHNEFQKFPQVGYSNLVSSIPCPGNMYDCAVSATWLERQKLQIKVQIIDNNLGNLAMNFCFKDTRIAVLMIKSAQAFMEEYSGRAIGVAES